MHSAAIVKFSQESLGLTSSEKKVVAKLVEAAKLISVIYEKQENFKYNGANFYPHDATKAEILKAADNNPEILCPYAMVERDSHKNLIATPSHIKFKKD